MPDQGGTQKAPALAKVAARLAAEVVPVANLEEEARALLGPKHTPREFLDLLLSRGLHEDAVRFVAAALPVREAIWWACLSLRLSAGAAPAPAPPAAAKPTSPLPPDLEIALRVVTRWVLQPGEPYRKQAAQLTGDERTTFLLQAVGYSGGSLVPPSLPPIPPSPLLTPRLAAGAIFAAAYSGPAEQAEERLRQYLALGIHLARGKHEYHPGAADLHQPTTAHPGPAGRTTRPPAIGGHP